MQDDKVYLQRVDEVLDRLRCACLGQDVPLLDVLPREGNSQDENADAIAEQFVLVLVTQNEWSAEEISAVNHWLRETIRYIFNETPPSDHIFRSIIRLAGVSREAVPFLADSEGYRLKRPECVSSQMLEVGILALVEHKGMMFPGTKQLEELESYLHKDHKGGFTS